MVILVVVDDMVPKSSGHQRGRRMKLRFQDFSVLAVLGQKGFIGGGKCEIVLCEGVSHQTPNDSGWNLEQLPSNEMLTILFSRYYYLKWFFILTMRTMKARVKLHVRYYSKVIKGVAG